VTPRPPQTPELDKLSHAHNETNTVRRFLDFLEEAGLVLARYHEKPDWLYAATERPKDLVNSFFELDPKKIEEERRALLDYQRALNEEGQS